MKLVLQIAIPLLIWLGVAWLASDGFTEPDELWYVLLMPLGILAFFGFLIGLIFFFRWLY